MGMPSGGVLPSPSGVAEGDTDGDGEGVSVGDGEGDSDGAGLSDGVSAAESSNVTRSERMFARRRLIPPMLCGGMKLTATSTARSAAAASQVRWV